MFDGDPPPEAEQTYGYRIGTVQGETRDVVVIRGRIYDDTGKIIDTQGFYINPHQQIRATGASRDA